MTQAHINYILFFVIVFIFISRHMFIFGISLGLNRNSCLLKGRKLTVLPKQKQHYARHFPFLG